MLIHDAIAEYILTQGDTEIRADDISKYLAQVTNQINGEMTSLDIQYNVSGRLTLQFTKPHSFDTKRNCLKLILKKL
jgi:hypothetical protein